jgi:predicted RNA binding protein YcfA (HicA-like mRNA interferase family)
MKKDKIFQKLLSGSKNISFEELILIILSFGFIEVRSKGSHHIFKKAGIDELVNFQNVDGKGKPYQIKQFLSLVEKYDLQME